MAEYYRDKTGLLAKLVKNPGEDFKVTAVLPNSGLTLLKGSYTTHAEALEALCTVSKTWKKSGED